VKGLTELGAIEVCPEDARNSLSGVENDRQVVSLQRSQLNPTRVAAGR